MKINKLSCCNGNLVIRELSLIMTGGGGGSLAASVWNFFPQICWGLKLLINIWLGSQTDFQLKEQI